MNLFLYQLKVARVTVLVFCLISAGLVLHRVPLQLLGALLQSPDDVSAVQADFAVLLLGDFVDRTEKAAEVIRGGRAQRVFWGRVGASEAEKRGYVQNEADFVEELLMKSGVSIDQMVKEDSCQNGSTADEARCFYDYFVKHPPFPKKVIIVTSWFHTRRGRWIFRRTFRGTDTEVVSLAARTFEGDAASWWKFESTGFSIITEYIKWGYYLAKY